jgi:hypothetical protein
VHCSTVGDRLDRRPSRGPAQRRQPADPAGQIFGLVRTVRACFCIQQQHDPVSSSTCRSTVCVSSYPACGEHALLLPKYRDGRSGALRRWSATAIAVSLKGISRAGFQRVACFPAPCVPRHPCMYGEHHQVLVLCWQAAASHGGRAPVSPAALDLDPSIVRAGVMQHRCENHLQHHRHFNPHTCGTTTTAQQHVSRCMHTVSTVVGCVP